MNSAERPGSTGGNEEPTTAPNAAEERQGLSYDDALAAVAAGRSYDDAHRAATKASPNTSSPATRPETRSNLDERIRTRGSMSRRAFVTGAGLALTSLAAAIAAGNRHSEPEESAPGANPEEPNSLDSSDDHETSDNHETEKFSTVRETLEFIDNEAFSNDPGLIFHNPRTPGGHYYAYENGEETEHWVAYHEELKEDPDFTEHYAGENFTGLETTDDYGAHFVHSIYNTTAAAAAELAALGHPDFKGLTQREAEQKILEAQEQSPEDNEARLEWLHKQHKNTKFEFVPIPQNEPIMNMGILDPGTANHGRFINYNSDELLRDEGNHLVEATTTLDDGTVVTRWFNPVCSNLLNKIRYEEPGNPPNEIVITTPDDDPTPETPDEPTPPDTPAPKNQAEADENSGATSDLVQPEGQSREITPEPTADPARPYNPETNTYTSTPAEEAREIGHEVTGGNPTAPSSTGGVAGTTQGASGGAGTPNNFDAGATVGTGEMTGTTSSADGSSNTIAQNLDNATGAPGADYSEGF